MITGESVPIEKEKGDEVIGGSVNKEGSIKVKVEKTGEESYLSQVITLVREAQGVQIKNTGSDQPCCQMAVLYCPRIRVYHLIRMANAWLFV